MRNQGIPTWKIIWPRIIATTPPSTGQIDHVVFHANDQAMAGLFRDASAVCALYPIITRARRVRRSMDRLCRAYPPEERPRR